MTDLLSISDLRTQFATDRGDVKAVDGVDLTIREGETVGLVGESGSGKSVTALSAMDLVDEPGEIADGEVALSAASLARNLLPRFADGVASYPKAVSDAAWRLAAALRARLVGGAVAVGLALGSVATVGAVVLARPGAVDAAFLAGTVAFGFGLLGWAGSAMAGRGVEAMQAHLDAGTDWTERDSRRAMARVGGVGLETMVGVTVVGSLLL